MTTQEAFWAILRWFFERLTNATRDLYEGSLSGWDYVHRRWYSLYARHYDPDEEPF